jgi:4-hydroxybenzoate polyprenyltransferase
LAVLLLNWVLSFNDERRNSVTTDATSKPSRLLAYLQLMRLPNVFTALADVAMGFLFTHEKLSPSSVFVLLLICSSALYTAGMVINDVFDLEQDRRERPQRPLPSGNVPLKNAVQLGFTLILVGEIVGAGAAWLAHDWRPVMIAPVLAILILRYNSRWKHTAAGPVAMGGCRFLNVLLGMSASPQPWSTVNWLVGSGIGLYIVGITWFARREATTSPRVHLIGGLITMLAGMALLWSFPKFLPPAMLMPIFDSQPQYWVLLWIALAALIGWRFVRAILRPQPANVQAAVKSGILSIVVLDAAVVLAVRGMWPAIGILLLLVPAIALGRWVYST